MDRPRRFLFPAFVVGATLYGCAGVPQGPSAYRVPEGGALVVQPERGVLVGYSGPRPLALEVVEAPKHATLFDLRSSGGFRYVHNGTETLSDSFLFAVRGGDDTSAAQRVEIAITPTNDAPMVPGLKLRTPQGTPVEGRLTVLDPDDNELQYVYEPPLKGTLRVEPDSEAFIYIPPQGYVGTDRFRATVVDGQGAESRAVVIVDVVAGPGGAVGNRAPRAGGLRLTTQEDQIVKARIDAGDPDGDEVVYTVSVPEHGLASVDRNGMVEYGARPDYNGSDRFTVTITDSQGASAEALVEVDITPVNDPPIAEDAVIVVSPGESVQGRLPVRDPDGDALTFEIVDDPDLGGAELLSGGTGSGGFIYKAPENSAGTDRFTYRASDGRTQSDIGEATIRIERPGQPG